jgi:serine/threonine-protein kinase HipA
MKKIVVFYEGWGERWPLATIAEDGHTLLFEYTAEALAQGLELSPRHLKLRAAAYSDFPSYQLGLPGLISDALPDGWGLQLMDRLFRKSNIDPAQVSVLDRLAFIGQRGLGALTFEPASEMGLHHEAVSLLELAQQASLLMAGKDSAMLKELALVGGSPHGARPKALVHYNPATEQLSTHGFFGSQAWLVKFQAEGEHKEVCAIENLYAELARASQLTIPETRYFDLDKKLAAFGIARFDQAEGLRIPVHTLAGLLHANFRVPGSVDYTTFLRATRFLTLDEREVQKAYERAVFNVLFNNRDDHPKNFSYLLAKNRRWVLSPAYDLTFCEGPGGYHQMDVCGEAQYIQRSDLLKLARQGGLEERWASQSIDRLLAVAGSFASRVKTRAIRPVTRKHLAGRIAENSRLLGTGG